jgi:capsule polysaccharide export protein KpsE/RkpR
VETLLNLLRAIGYIGGLVAVFVVIARVWSGTARERLITYLQSELKAAREHCDEADKTVKHYRDEMHDVRAACEGEVKKAQVQLEETKDQLTASKLENVKLHARPDLTTIEELVKGQTEMMTSHIECDKKVFTSFEKSFREIAKHLKSLRRVA